MFVPASVKLRSRLRARWLVRQITDFGRRPVLIARQVSWSPDGRFIYAAVLEQDADILLLEGIVPQEETWTRHARGMGMRWDATATGP
jgi:hypothetical protein